MRLRNLCRGCVARSCYMNCPKDAIRFKKNGQAEIDHDTCISCGKCHQNCPYHAIVYIPIPCEEVCPVKAISKDEYGVEHIDESKCIYCGKCVNACPFGAIFEISQVFDILQRLRNKEPMVAIVAPSILAQFAAPVEKVYGAIKSLGFLEVVEVAQEHGDDPPRSRRTERKVGGRPTVYDDQLLSVLYSACRETYPGLEKIYFDYRFADVLHRPDREGEISGCQDRVRRPVRGEAERSEDGPLCGFYAHVRRGRSSVLAGMDIKIEEAQPFTVLRNSVREAHGFAQAGGVINAVKVYLKEDQDASLNTIQVANLTKKNVALLRAYAKTGRLRDNLSR